jgi:L-lactate dehydrogenase complex protein LldE
VKVHLFIPCFVDQLYPQTAVNMVKILRKAGCEVHYNPKQTCCGQPAFNAGYQEDAKAVAEKFLRDFSGNEAIVAPSASCVGHVKNYYGHYFKDSADWAACQAVQGAMFEFSQFMVDRLGVTDLGASLPGKATFHDSCSGLRECGIGPGPRKLLAKVRGLELIELQDNTQCCGFGGTFAVKFEPIAVAMAEQKVDNAVATGADYLISTDLSCLMHLDGYIQKFKRPIRTMHLVDVLASGW